MPAWAKTVIGVVAVMSAAVLIPAAPAVAATPDCGPAITKADGSAWTCTFADDFPGTALDRTKWHVQTTAESGFSLGGECYVDNKNNVSVSGGQLNLTLKRASFASTCPDPRKKFSTRYTAGSVDTWGTFSQAFGRFEFRATFPSIKQPGVQSSIWLWPVENTYGPWPFSGEIDVAEWYSKYWDRAIPFLKYGGMYTDPDATNNYCLIDYGKSHTFVLEWAPTGITISYDGTTCLRNTRWFTGLYGTAPFDKPFILALTQILGTGNNAPNWLTPSTATTKVDWVRVWS